jgi:methyl-accepting chemotaxis protein
MLTMGVMLAFLIIVVLIVFSSISNLQEQQQTFYDKNMTSTLELMRLRGNAIRMRAALFFMLLADSQAVHEKQKAEIADTVKNSQEILPKLTQRFKDDPQMSKSIGALNTAMNSFISEQQDELIPLIEQHQTDNAKMLIFGVQGNSLQQIIDLASKLGVDAHDKAEAELNLAKESASRSKVLCLAVSVIAVILSAWAYFSLVRSLSAATAQLTEAVSILGNGVDQILASVTESAAGTAETASAVSETTSTVEELKHTSQLSSDRANSVFENAQRAQQISATGRNATEQTIEGMKKIRKQMDQIAESMGHLSDKARSIVEIIATVDDLAKQSNLLAVNAAIEAAKAGDHGKGFSVVAQQVKSMADQSKQATAQVRAILDEIQNAAGAAAKATELGSQSVDVAVKQSTQAGESIVLLATSVSESAVSAAQIASASKQQVQGVDQVVTAMSGINEAANQNVSAIARVEDAANNLSQLGSRLKELVKGY